MRSRHILRGKHPLTTPAEPLKSGLLSAVEFRSFYPWAAELCNRLEGGLTRRHDVLDHGLHLSQSISLSLPVSGAQQKPSSQQPVPTLANINSAATSGPAHIASTSSGRREMDTGRRWRTRWQPCSRSGVIYFEEPSENKSKKNPDAFPVLGSAR